MDVVIPTYNPGKELLETLDSVKEMKTILVDDCSSNKKYIKKAQEKFNLILIRNEENRGQGISRNIGFGYTDSEKVLFLDDDVVFSENALKDVENFLDDWDMVIYSEVPELEVTENIYAMGGNYFAFRREKFEGLNGFIEFRRREDIDIVLKAIRKGYKIKGYSRGGRASKKF